MSLGTGGVLVVMCDQLSGTVELILDVNGYFERRGRGSPYFSS